MYLIKNNLRKESLLVLALGLIAGGELTYLLVNFFLSEKKDLSFNGFYFPLVLFSILIIIAVLWFVYLISYRVNISDEEIEFKTILKTRIVLFKDVKSYSIGKYRRASYFQFRIDTEDESIYINVKDKRKFIELLKEKGIQIVD